MAVQIKPEQAYAYAELLEILSFMEEKYIKKIPKKLMSIFETNALSTYEKHIDGNKPLIEQKITRKTSALLAVLTVQYWCETQEQKQELLNIFEQNQIKHDEEIRRKYNPDNIFNKDKEFMDNLDSRLDEIDEIDRISAKEKEKAEAIKEERKAMEENKESINNQETTDENIGMLMDYNSFPWYKKMFTKVKTFIFNIFKNKKNAA